MASGPYATEDSASSDSAASPWTAVSRCCSSWSTATLWPGPVVIATACHQRRSRRGTRDYSQVTTLAQARDHEHEHEHDDDHARDDQHGRRYGRASRPGSVFIPA